MKHPIVNLYGGAGGWEVGGQVVGLDDILGIELDADACATSRAAGFNGLDETSVLGVHVPTPLGGLIASPPCQSFSSAGTGEGREILDVLAATVRVRFGLGLADDEALHMEAIGDIVIDERSAHVLEPIRWIKSGAPRWIAFEQVPSVLPVWEAYRDALVSRGYSAWCGVLSAERYGVPQTRQRAILIASLDHEVSEPPATHQRYTAKRKFDGEDMLFPAEEFTVDRIVHDDDRELLPWVSMLEALTAAGCAPDFNAEYVNGNQDNSARRALTAPAPVSILEPAPVVTSKARSALWKWTGDRPATTIICAPRVSAPGHKGDGVDAPRQHEQAIRVSVAQAAVLQSFPVGHPWQGSKTSQHRQVGNAIPPLLGAHVLGAAVRLP